MKYFLKYFMTGHLTGIGDEISMGNISSDRKGKA
jgi:hypothetical protein